MKDWLITAELFMNASRIESVKESKNLCSREVP